MEGKRTGTFNPLKSLPLILEKIGKPFYWLFLIVIIFLGYLFNLLKKIPSLIKEGQKKKGKKRKLRLPKIGIEIKIERRKKSKKKTVVLFPRWPHKIKQLSLKLLFSFKSLFKLSTKKIITIFTILFILVLGFLTYFFILKGLPNPNKLITRNQIVSTKIYDRNGNLLYKIYRGQNRTLIDLQEVPLHLIQATIAIEDAEFYQHHGFSPKGIFRAVLTNLKGKKLYGGSTITQQLVKNALLTPERTLKRKIREFILAIMVEIKFSKDEILQMYLNEVGYGGATYGIEEASQIYFDKSVEELTLTEAALLAGLPASPTTYSPFGAFPKLAKERQKIVLGRMRQEGFITPEQEEEAVRKEIKFVPQKTNIEAPHFVMYVKEFLSQKYGERMIEEGGLEVTTSLDLEIHQKTQEIVTQEINQLNRLKIGNGAALVTNPQNGEILAMVGSRDYFSEENDGNVNVTLSLRQPGSAIKPINYAVALQNGFTPATIIPDTPITYFLPGTEPYSPKNYDNRFHGNVTLRTALASSYNIPAVKVLSALGVEQMIEMGQKMGITSWDDPSRFGLSLTLGGGEIRMIDLAVVYGTLANLGSKANLNPILEIKNYKGEIIESQKDNLKPQKVLPANIAYLLTDILSDNRARTPAFGPSSLLNIKDHSHVAVKTGTTQNQRDNWTIGYTADYLVATWVGNNDNTPMSYVASGVTGASPIWNKTMTYLLKDIPDKEFNQPKDLRKIQVCSLTNTLPCNGCPTKWELFLPGTEPKTHCNAEEIKKIIEDSQKPTPSL